MTHKIFLYWNFVLSTALLLTSPHSPFFIHIDFSTTHNHPKSLSRWLSLPQSCLFSPLSSQWLFTIYSVPRNIFLKQISLSHWVSFLWDDRSSIIITTHLFIHSFHLACINSLICSKTYLIFLGTRNIPVNKTDNVSFLRSLHRTDGGGGSWIL